jgi:transcriptional regulator with XRE-family HTH domain
MQELTKSEVDAMYRKIGINVMRIRKEKGMSQLDLALSIGLKSVGLISVAEICHNKKHFNLEHLYKIAKILDVKIADFLIDIE